MVSKLLSGITALHHLLVIPDLWQPAVTTDSTSDIIVLACLIITYERLVSQCPSGLLHTTTQAARTALMLIWAHPHLHTSGHAVTLVVLLPFPGLRFPAHHLLHGCLHRCTHS